MPGLPGPPVKGKSPYKPTVKAKPKPGSGPSRPVPDPRRGGGFDTANSEIPGNRPLNVAGLRAHLRNVGYDIPAEGATIGPKMKAALADYLQVGDKNPLAPSMAKLLNGTVITGRRDPDSWNQRFGSKKTRPVVQTTQLDPNGNLDVSGAASDQAAPALDFSSLFAGVNAPSTRPLPAAWATGGARLFSNDVPEQLAAMQFDGQIAENQQLAGNAPKITAQNMADVGNWYGQVLGSQKTAAVRDSALNAAAVDSVQGAGASILSAIGGQASQGAGSVGAANQAAVGTLEALGANQEAFNNDLRPLLEAERAGARTQEMVRGTNRSKELADRLAVLQGDRGRAKAGFQFQVDQSNNAIRDTRSQRALEIRQANNGVAQQNFQNALALVNAQMGAAVTGLDIQGKLADLSGAGGKPTSYPFAKAPVSQREDAFNNALARISGGGADGKPLPYPQAVQAVRNTINGYGWSFRNPAVRSLAMNIMRQAGFNPDPRTLGPRG